MNRNLWFLACTMVCWWCFILMIFQSDIIFSTIQIFYVFKSVVITSLSLFSVDGPTYQRNGVHGKMCYTPVFVDPFPSSYAFLRSCPVSHLVYGGSSPRLRDFVLPFSDLVQFLICSLGEALHVSGILSSSPSTLQRKLSKSQGSCPFLFVFTPMHFSWLFLSAYDHVHVSHWES